MEFEGLKSDLHRYLQAGREALLWKLDGLSEYDWTSRMRRSFPIKVIFTIFDGQIYRCL
jgi:hypothetical protein